MDDYIQTATDNKAQYKNNNINNSFGTNNYYRHIVLMKK